MRKTHKFIGFRVEVEDYNLIDEDALDQNKTISDYCRDVLLSRDASKEWEKNKKVIDGMKDFLSDYKRSKRDFEGRQIELLRRIYLLTKLHIDLMKLFEKLGDSTIISQEIYEQYLDEAFKRYPANYKSDLNIDYLSGLNTLKSQNLDHEEDKKQEDKEDENQSNEEDGNQTESK